MSGRFSASVIAGLIAGVVFGLTMQMMTAPTPDGGRMPMLAMVGQIVGSPTIGVGWLYHLFNSAIIGAMFGWLLGGRVHTYASGVGWGAAYGFGWWILGGLILMPVFLGMPVFAPLMMPPMRMVAMGSLIGHLISASCSVPGLCGSALWLRTELRFARELRYRVVSLASSCENRCSPVEIIGVHCRRFRRYVPVRCVSTLYIQGC
jgi:hypothetical protein